MRLLAEQGIEARARRAADHPAHAEERRRQPRLRRRRRASPPGCCATSARSRSKSTASMTTAACSTPRATAPCSMRSAGSMRAAVDRCVGGGYADRGRAGRSPRRRRRGRARPRIARTCQRRDRGAGARGRRGDAPRRGARGDAGGAQGRRIADRARRAARRVGRRAGAACARRRGGSSAAPPIIRLLGRGAGGARPRGDRGERGRGPDRPRRRRAGVRSGAARAGRGAAVRHPRRSPASIASSPTRWRRSARRCARSWRRSRPAASGSPSSTAQLVAAREAYAAAARAAERASATRPPPRLDAAVAAELAPLKLDAARFRTAHRARPSPGRAGTDRVEFEVSTNPGAPFGPLTRIASGGELSRFILALKVALAEAGSAATMIFDEVDRGVGGAVASAIGERLARLAAADPGAGRHPLAAGRGPRLAPLPDRKEPRRRRHAHHRPQARAQTSGARRSPACCRARRSPRRRGRRRRACSTRHDGLCRAAARR